MYRKGLFVLLSLSLMLGLAAHVQGTERADAAAYTCLSIQSGANAKLFLTYGETDTAYRKFIDYMGYSDRSVIDDSSPYTPYAICLSENGESDGARLLLENGCWWVDGVPYRIEPSDPVVKLLRYADTSALSDLTLREALGKMNTAEIDVEDGFYREIKLLMSSANGDASVRATVTYTDGETEECMLSLVQRPFEGTEREKGYIISRFAENTASSAVQVGRRFTAYTVQTDGTKEVDKIRLAVLDTWRDVYLIAASGVNTGEQALKAAAETLMARINAVDVSNAGMEEYADFVKCEYLLQSLERLYGVTPEQFPGIALYQSRQAQLAQVTGRYLQDGEVFRLYVSADGSDSGTGTETDPFATIRQARDAIRYARDYRFKGFPIQVLIGEGEYSFEETLCFSAENSGFPGGEITYLAQEGQRVVFSGSKRLDTSALYQAEANADAIMARIPAAARKHVYSVNLAEQGMAKVAAFLPNAAYDVTEDVLVIENGRVNPVAQWPNGEVNMALAERVIDSGGIATAELVHENGGSIEIAADKAKLWQGLKSCEGYIQGAFYQPWQMERILIDAVDPQENSLRLYAGSYMGIDPSNWGGIRFKAMHIPEELDAPGEWYLDRDTDILYIYPQSDIETMRLEVAAGTGLLYFDNLSYVNFRGILFQNSGGNAIYSEKNLRNVNIRNCTFQNIASDAIRIEGETDYKVIGSKVNAAYDLQVTGNDFQYIGGAAYRINGSGHSGTLTMSNNLFSDNYIYKAAQNTLGYAVRGSNLVGDEFSHNMLHNLQAGGITFTGNECKILNNEIYNLGQNFADCGGIYTGRTYIRRGNEIAYNFIHSNRPLTTQMLSHHRAIYLDDGASGQHVHHNIGYDISYFCSQSGKENVINGNIAVNENKSAITLGVSDYLTDDQMLTPLERVRTSELYREYWIEKYPQLLTVDTLDPYDNVISNNVSNLEMWTADTFAQHNDLDTTLRNNYVLGIGNMAEFADADNLDFRLKADSAVLQTVTDTLTEENFDIEQIGLFTKRRFHSENASFDMLTPADNSTIAAAAPIRFSWQDACGADKYLLRIAKDPAMQEIVYEQETFLTYFEAADMALERGVYYWTVTAYHTSRQLKCDWESGAAVHSFRIADVLAAQSKYEFVDLTAYCNAKAALAAGQTDARQDENKNYMYRSAYVPNLTRLKSALNRNNAVKAGDVWYRLNQIDNPYKAIFNYSKEAREFLIEIPENRYETLYFLAEKNIQDCAGCYVTLHYADGVTEQKSLLEKVTNGAILPQVFTGAVWITTGQPRNDWFRAGLYSHPVTPSRDVPIVSVGIASTDVVADGFSLYALTGKVKTDGMLFVTNQTETALEVTLIDALKNIQGGVEKLQIETKSLNPKETVLYHIQSTAELPQTLTAETYLWDMDTLSSYTPVLY